MNRLWNRFITLPMVRMLREGHEDAMGLGMDPCLRKICRVAIDVIITNG